MSINDAALALTEALGGSRELLPVFEDGEQLIIQRTVNGQNVLMVVTVSGPCSLSPDRMVLNARLQKWGVSSYADGRVANQAASITRLQARIARIAKAAEEATGTPGIAAVLEAVYAPDPEPEIPTQPVMHHQV